MYLKIFLIDSLFFNLVRNKSVIQPPPLDYNYETDHIRSDIYLHDWLHFWT